MIFRVSYSEKNNDRWRQSDLSRFYFTFYGLLTNEAVASTTAEHEVPGSILGWSEVLRPTSSLNSDNKLDYPLLDKNTPTSFGNEERINIGSQTECKYIRFVVQFIYLIYSIIPHLSTDQHQTLKMSSKTKSVMQQFCYINPAILNCAHAAYKWPT